MKYAEIMEMTSEDLQERLSEVELDLTRKKMNHAVSPLENPMEIRTIRRTIARINTELRRREIEAVNNSEKSE